jgi:hypothetical protein
VQWGETRLFLDEDLAKIRPQGAHGVGSGNRGWGWSASASGAVGLTPGAVRDTGHFLRGPWASLNCQWAALCRAGP